MVVVTVIKNFKMNSSNIKHEMEEYVEELEASGTLVSHSSVPDYVNKRIKVVVRVEE